MVTNISIEFLFFNVISTLWCFLKFVLDFTFLHIYIMLYWCKILIVFLCFCCDYYLEICGTFLQLDGDNKYPRLFRTLLSILIDISNILLWRFSIVTRNSCSSFSLDKCLQNFPCTPTTMATTVSIFYELSVSKYWFILSFSFDFVLQPSGLKISQKCPLIFCLFAIN